MNKIISWGCRKCQRFQNSTKYGDTSGDVKCRFCGHQTNARQAALKIHTNAITASAWLAWYKNEHSLR